MALIETRKNAGITQTELAKRLGEYQSFVARLESGQRRVDFVELLEIIEILGVDLLELTNKVVEETPIGKSK